MTLVDQDLGLEIHLNDFRPTILLIESPHIYADIMLSFWSQNQGNDGRLLVYEKDKPKRIGKEMCFINSVLGLDCNEKKILNKVYDSLADHLQDNIDDLASVNSQVVALLDRISFAEPYHIAFNLDLDAKSLLKLYDVHLDYETTDLVERIIDYLRIQHQICKIGSFAIVGMIGFLTETERQQVYTFAAYEHIELLLIETAITSPFHDEKVFIIDADGCIIEP